jgi:hypothetical protein
MHALNELDAKAYSFFRRRGLFDKDFMQLLSHVLVGTILSKIVPFLYGEPRVVLRRWLRSQSSEARPTGTRVRPADPLCVLP